MEISEFNEENYVIINISNGAIWNYEWTENFPTASLQIKIIIIDNPKKNRVSGISIKKNIAIRSLL